MEQNKILEIILAKMDDMKAHQEEMLARMDADKAETKREREADKEEMMARMEAKLDSNHERMMAKMDAWLGKTEACQEVTIHLIYSLPSSAVLCSLSSLGQYTNCRISGRRVTMPVPLGRKERPTKLSMTELFPELCNVCISYIK
jgi:hypothetical protein